MKPHELGHLDQWLVLKTYNLPQVAHYEKKFEYNHQITWIHNFKIPEKLISRPRRFHLRILPNV